MGGKVGQILKAALVVAAVATGVAFIPGFGALATGAFAGGTAAYFGGQFLAAAVLGVVSSAITSTPSFPTVAELEGRTISQRNPLATRKIIYGTVRLGGAVTFLEGGNNRKDLHTVISFAGHEINAVKAVYFGDVLISENLTDGAETTPNSGTGPDYSGVTKITAHFGGASQAHDANLVGLTSADSNFRQRGVAHLYAKMTSDQDVFINGLPNISLVIEGRKVYDPRAGLTAYSDNPALCIRDYIADGVYGLGAAASEIDDALFIIAANICDELVTLNSGGTEKRYTMNGVIDSAKTPKVVLAQMMTACSGQLFYANGQWKMRAGKYITPTDTLTLDDLRGPIKVETRMSGRNQFNAVKGIFVSPDNNWQATDFPEITSSVFQSEDGGERKYIDHTLPFTTSSAMAQRLGKQALYRNREQLTVTLPCKLTAFKYEIGDTLKFTHERFGWNEKVFEVIAWNLTPVINESGATLGVDLMVKETSPAVYDWNESVDEKAFTFNNTTLPDPFSNIAPNLTVSDELRTLNQEAVSVLVINVTGGDNFVGQFEVQSIKAGDLEYINIGKATGNRFELLSVQDNAVYTVRARTVSAIGVRSAWAIQSHQVVGKTAPPTDVKGLTGNLIGNQYILTWDAVPDLDLSHYRVRFAAENGVVTYQNAVDLVPKVSRPATSVTVPARNGTYFVKAIDKLGLASESPAAISLSTNIADIEALNVVQLINEHSNFTGTKSGTVVDIQESRIILDTHLNFDSMAGNFDDTLGLFDAGGGNVIDEGFYYFSNSVDLGAVYTSRVTATLQSVRIDYVNLFDSTLGLFDDRTGPFDGDVNAFDNTDTQLQVRFTQTDPAGSPTWANWQTFQVSDIKAWGMQFRCRMTTKDAQASPSVNYLSVEIDMPDRTDGADDIASGPGTKVVTFNQAFKANPALGIGAQDLQTGDYYEISAKQRNSFAITFKSANGTAVDRTFDWVARGYGREVA